VAVDCEEVAACDGGSDVEIFGDELMSAVLLLREELL